MMNRALAEVLILSWLFVAGSEGPSAAQDEAGPIPAEWHVDRSLYPKGYGIVSNGNLIHPVDMSDCPVKIDSSHQLFVDDYLIASTTDVEREIHQPKRHPANPVLITDREDRAFSVYLPYVHRDKETGRFRMWYSGDNSRYTMPSGVSARWPMLYAESDDGIVWRTPELGLFEWKGSKANNIVIPAGPLAGVFLEPNDPDPDRRYKAIVWHEPEFVPREALFLYASADGIRWRKDREKPVLFAVARYTMPQTGVGDTSIFRWDHQLNKYVGDVKFVLPGVMRCFGMTESDDLVHWTAPRMTLYPDGLDEADTQIYGHRGFCYEGMWLGFLRAMHTDRNGWKQTPVELTASRDGRHWARVGQREEFLPASGDSEDWDADYHNTSSAPILVGDELWVYYESSIRPDHDRERGDRHGLGLAVLRRDGFASLNAGETPGTVVTRPLTCSGKLLFVNAEVDDGGYVKVALRTLHDGQDVDPYSLADCTPIVTGTTAGRITWEDGDALENPIDATARLVFELKKAKLYSFWIQ